MELRLKFFRRHSIGVTERLLRHISTGNHPLHSDTKVEANKNDFYKEDPVMVLRKMQQKIKQSNAAAPPSPPRRHGKHMFFEEKALPSPKSETKKNVFLEKLVSMEKESSSVEFPTYNLSRETRQKKKEDAILSERAKLLVFRDVGMDLDKPILSRDVFLLWKYFRLGKDFAIDNELERMLRYFNEHAVNELKIIHNSKLMRGTETLFEKINHSSTLGTLAKKLKKVSTGSNSLLFPSVRCANTAQFCPNISAAVQDEIIGLLFNTTSMFKPFVEQRSREQDTPRKYNAKDDALFYQLSSSSFKRPAVVIFSQMGQKFGGDADAAWRKLSYETICPSVHSETLPVSIASMNAVKSLPIDVISLRSTDLYKFQWVQKLYVQRFIGFLSASLSTQDSFGNQLIASTSFVGSALLRPFFNTFGLRNYLSPYTMLVDHEGCVRWMSGGCPDAWEEKVFPQLLRQLVLEYQTKK